MKSCKMIEESLTYWTTLFWWAKFLNRKKFDAELSKSGSHLEEGEIFLEILTTPQKKI